VRAELKSLFSAETPGSLDEYVPADPDHFGISIQAFIGSTDSDAVDSFDVVVCTPSWLTEHFDDEQLPRSAWEPRSLRFGNRYVFMKRWDYEALKCAIDGLCASHDADDWGTLANRIGRCMPWEFDYRYDDFIDETANQRPRFPPE
jgi:hypothetical protein